MNRLHDRVAIVTGAAQGIGRALAAGFAAEGARVIIADLNLEKAEATAAEHRAAGHQVIALPLDLGDPTSIRDMVAEVIERFGQVDVLVNNAAFFTALRIGPFETITAEEWDRVMTINVRGLFLACQAVAPHMRAQQRGSIINIGAAMMLHGRGGFAHYIASKSAVLGLSRTLATELGGDQVRVNVIMPGGTQTETPRRLSPEQEARLLADQAIHRWGTTDDLIGAAVFFASDDSAFITGQALTVDGGHDYY
jgi:3-oxoacyl-[acyl-carrier protein] reductase